jgi:hypothetical protein
MQSELAEARLALKAASKVETDLTIKAASFTGKLFFFSFLIFFMRLPHSASAQASFF